MTSVSILHQLPLRLLNISHQILDRTHLQTPFLSKSQAAVPPHHARLPHQRLARNRLPILHQLAYDTHQGLARQSAELNRGLRMADALPHAALLGPQRQDVTGTAQARLGRRGARQRPARQRPVMRADAGRRLGRVRIDRDGVRGAVRVLVAGHHLREVQMLGERGRHGRAHEPRRVPDHEGHLLGRHVRGGYDQVAFILARQVVEDDYEFAIFWERGVVSRGGTENRWGEAPIQGSARELMDPTY